jgi:hypothetical protein
MMRVCVEVPAIQEFEPEIIVRVMSCSSLSDKEVRWLNER